jgi:vancomycin permeability regulator SanA
MRKFSPKFLFPRKRRKLWFGLAATLLFAGMVVLLAPWWVDRATASDIYRDINRVPAQPVGIVFGAGVAPNGAMSSVLEARVAAGVALYKAGKVQKLLMTGDNGRIDYNEVTPMKEYAVAHGVPPQDVVRDYAGFHTFDSCYRARHVFGVDRAILVTQAFHLPRAVYMARTMGIDAVGYVAPDAMDERSVAFFEHRERWTILGNLIDLHDGHKPTFPGPPDPLFGSDSPDR